MKNFILVINKEKIYAYVLSICTIVTLFFMSTFINKKFDETEQTSSNLVEGIVENDNLVDNTNNECN